MDKEKAERIAQWWCDRLEDSRKFDNGNPDDEKRAEGLENKLVAAGFSLKPKQEITVDHKAKFKFSLRTLLLTSDAGLEFVEVDYHPDDILETALELAEIKGNPLPIKTFVQVREMKGRIGYSGELKDI